MPTYIQRPNSLVSAVNTTMPDDNASVLTSLGDNSDATAVRGWVAFSPAASRTFKTLQATVPASEFVARVGVSLRYRHGEGWGPVAFGAAVWNAAIEGQNGPTTQWLEPPPTSSYTNAEITVRDVSWPVSDLNAVWVRWSDDQTQGSEGLSDTAEIWANIYTLAKATATPSNTTEITSGFATIPVTVAATLGWEAGAAANLRKVTTELRVESGGTGPGTGTLLSTVTADHTFTTSGNVVLNMTTPDMIPNGTYKVYARTLRYRADGVTRADQYGDWSAAATLTMDLPVPNAPTIAVSADQTNERVQVSVTAATQAGFTSPLVTVERSDDEGASWLTVRGALLAPTAYDAEFVVYDYEATRGVSLTYRARITATYGTSSNASAWATSANTSLIAAVWNLKDVADSSLNIVGLNVTGSPTEDMTEQQGVFSPLGRRYPVIVSGAVSGWDGQLEVTTASASEWTALVKLIESQNVLLLESVFGWSKYVRLLSGTKAALTGTPSAPRRSVSIKYVEVERPAIESGA